jgi:NADH-quinone oxidoreductase subunit M
VITTITILLPLLGAILMLFLPDDERLVRYAALVVAAVPLLVVTYIYFAYGDDLGAASLTQDLTWIESLNVGYRVGLDGLGFGMFFLSALLTVIAGARVVGRAEKPQAVLRRAVRRGGRDARGVRGARSDPVLRLLRDHAHPDDLLVGIWGDENRRPAAIKFFIYTFLGSTVMLAGFLASASSPVATRWTP